MKRKVLLSFFRFVLVISVLPISCKKSEHGIKIPIVITTRADSISYTSAKCGGSILSDGGADLTGHGVCWNTTGNPTIQNDKIELTDTSVSYGCFLTELVPNTTYYVKAYAENSAGTAYGDEITFTTLETAFAVLSTSDVTKIGLTTATSGGNITSNGGTDITARGVCWNTSGNPTIADNLTADSSGTGIFSSTITYLLPGTMYYVRAYATNGNGTSYGNELSFETTKPRLPSLITLSVSGVTATSATGGGKIVDDGGGPVTERGVCWNTSPNPTISDNKVSSGSGTGSFTGKMTGLKGSTVYYVKAYAVNSAGTAYGPQISFTTVNGNVTYTLVKVANPTTEQQNAYNMITAAMDSAVWYYNKYTSIAKSITVYYEPSVPTADGNINGTIRFGSNTSYMQKATSMHEIAHTVGVGTSSAWSTLMVGGVYQGANATAVLRSITGNPDDLIHGDTQHFWPYGLNYESEYKSAADLVNHCLIVDAMKQDGL